jgi:hypothetical protein
MPKRPALFLLLFLLLLTLYPTAHADETTKAAKIQQLFEITHVDRLMNQMADQMLGQMNAMMKQQTAGTDLTPKQRDIMSTFTTKVGGMVKGQLDWNKLKPQFITLYATTYTEPEIDAILAFYRSPAGQTMLAKLPELSAKSMQIGQTQVTALIPQLRTMSEDFSRQMTAAASTPPASTSPTSTPPPASTPAARP